MTGNILSIFLSAALQARSACLQEYGKSVHEVEKEAYFGF